jgi:hypothetical protein
VGKRTTNILLSTYGFLFPATHVRCPLSKIFFGNTGHGFRGQVVPRPHRDQLNPREPSILHGTSFTPIFATMRMNVAELFFEDWFRYASSPPDSSWLPNNW